MSTPLIILLFIAALFILGAIRIRSSHQRNLGADLFDQNVNEYREWQRRRFPERFNKDGSYKQP